MTGLLVLETLIFLQCSDAEDVFAGLCKKEALLVSDSTFFTQLGFVTTTFTILTSDESCVATSENNQLGD